MADIKVRDLTLCAAARQKPHIIVPIMTKTCSEAACLAVSLARLPAAEMVELRLDPLPGKDRAEALRAVRGALRASQPLLLTLRTAREGGKADLEPVAYQQALTELLSWPVKPDLVDIEFRAGPKAAAHLTRAAHDAGVYTVFSRHFFDGTPSRREMTEILCAMADAGADIVKLAVMPTEASQAADLLAATADAAAARPDTPRLTMAMGPLGAPTRVVGGAWGSCATFGAYGHKESAPGQPDAIALASALEALQDCLA